MGLGGSPLLAETRNCSLSQPVEVSGTRWISTWNSMPGILRKESSSFTRLEKAREAFFRS